MDKTEIPVTPEEQQKQVFRRIRNYLAGRLVGTTRDTALMHEVVKCLFCRVKLNGQAPHVSSASSEDAFDIAKTYRATFAILRHELPSVFEPTEELLMDPNSIAYVNDQLTSINLYEPARDPLGDLYETFVGTSVQQNEGQFFTPQNAISWLVQAVDPRPGELVIDPACGAGGFLSFVARQLKRARASNEEIASNLFGVEKDWYLARLANAHIALTTLAQSKIACGDSLAWIDSDGNSLPQEYIGEFDIVLTNPPFGAKIVSADERVRDEYSLARKWKLDRHTGKWKKTSELQRNSPPQVLFVERCISLLKPGGRLGFVVPESLVSSASHGYVVQYLRECAQLKAVVGMPENLFKTSGKGGTHTKTCLIIAEKRKSPISAGARGSRVFMAEAKWCGHDSRGRRIALDDLPEILGNFKSERSSEQSHLGYWVAEETANTNNLAPRYHDPATELNLNVLKKTHELVKVGELVKEGVLSFSTGDEIGKMAYGTGDIPFVRTSDISSWEIKIDPKHGVSEEIYLKYKDRQDVRAGDILMVRDGTYLIGNCAFVSEYDEKIVFQSHLYKIRVNKPDRISPYLLLALFSCEPVLKQIKAKRVTQDIIDSLGDRVNEIYLPIPKNRTAQAEVEQMVKSSIRDRIEARELARAAKRMVVATNAPHLQPVPGIGSESNALPNQRRGGHRGS
jgi:type I restriction enzyme M protein